MILPNAAPDKSARQTIFGYFHHSNQSSFSPAYEKKRIIFAIDCKYDPASRFETEFFSQPPASEVVRI
ncbi:hypothetical protein [Ligilactobacillus ruminis]|uniref:hypothetical protein n=1 Tax=Ligilactobacillus ruminis TaxID=1623 RepID=UPI001427C227|nr:hypothetical protein [Ligilactobacillus ruminis]